MLMTVAI